MTLRRRMSAKERGIILAAVLCCVETLVADRWMNLMS